MPNDNKKALNKTLAEIKTGQQVMLCKNKMDQQLEKKLMALGFSKLMPLEVTQKRKGGLVVGIGNARIALNETLAQQVLIETL
ncbi:MAG: ferrous iron transport protein A [Cycloclasticus sp.]|nr:ferrous iron transport protein A [Cycloclasticus sp.]MBG97177.1 ferrous iron transport protein A [Cycloclasticus sp.]HAI95860.1 ferrous iron transport protein A [Methylococcaceae bacterium]|tara:strand:- start:19 stop:267 length:249 start_codon:yes stop_codon:yes gene_type:complete